MIGIKLGSSFVVGALLSAIIPSPEPSEVGRLMLAARDCEEARTIFESCGMGTTSDVMLGRLVVEKCEATFDRELSAAQRRNYERAQGACGRKYAT